MFEEKRKFIYSITCAAIFIIMEIAALGMLQKHGELQDIWISRFSNRTKALLWGEDEKLKSYFSLRRQNDALAEENFLLQQEITRLSGKAIDSDLSSFENSFEGFDCIPAVIVKMSSNSQHNYIILNKGSEDGVRPQSGIITRQGVIGVIDAVDEHYSYGLSFLNNLSSVSVRIGESGPVGPLSWAGGNSRKALLKEIPLHSEFSQGDTVITSGYSSIFPPDIPLGVIQSSKVSDGTSYEIEISLFEDFSALRYVTIVTNAGKDEIIRLEELEEQEDEQ